MNVTLKKAAVLAAAITIPAIETQVVQVSIFQDENLDITKLVADAREQQRVELETALQALGARYKIRLLIGQANAAAGIDDLITERALVDLEIAMIEKVKVVDREIDDAMLKRQLADMREGNKKTESYNRREGINIPVPNDFIPPLVKKLKRRRREIDDKLAQLNFATTIELPKEVVAILTDQDLV